jgi:cell division septation protein DedD
MRLWLILPAFVLFACSASREVVKKKEIENKPPYDESFDPLSLNDNDIVVTPVKPGVSDTKEQAAQNNKKIPHSETNGFRVQILATNNLEKASLVEQEASERFKRSGYSTYLVFEAPLYKIRIGDCTDRLQAEKIRDMAKSVGYDGAFIVKSVVIVPE